MVAGPEGVELDFGDLITTRGGGEVKWVLAVLLMLFGGFLLIGSVPEVIREARFGRYGMLPVPFVGAAICGLSVWVLQLARIKTEFYVQGVIVKRGGNVLRSMPYAICEQFRFESTRHYYNGLYTGTIIDLRLRATGWPSIKWNGKHKEKPKGLAITFLGKNFKGEDELDAIKFIIAEHVADKWLAEFDAGRPVLWQTLELSSRGIVPQRGKFKDELIMYQQVVMLPLGAGNFGFSRVGEKKHFAIIAMRDENFWAWMSLLERLGGKETEMNDEAANSVE